MLAFEYDEAANRYRLFRGRNYAKDQSYFLWELTQEQLSNAYFPLGEMHKEEVRDVARDANLYTANKPESQEICFVPDGKYSEFIDRYLDHEGRTDQLPAGGQIVDTAGNGCRLAHRDSSLYHRSAPRPRDRP
jgi:tRNA-specific 2-thiouridylase